MMDASYVEGADFCVRSDQTIGCLGRKLRIRAYRLAANPDTRPGRDIAPSVVASWAAAGQPSDAVFHLGDFHRVTVV